MAGVAAGALREWLEQRQAAMLALLERLAEAESPTLDAEAQRRPLALLAAELERADFLTRTVRGCGTGDHLYARPRAHPRGAPRQLLLGHVDTVWPCGTLETMPLRHDGGFLFGPGVADMKAGLVILVFALHVLAAFDQVPPATPVVLINSDEELGSPDSTRLIRLLASGAARAFVLEAGEGPRGALKIARKGVGNFTVTVGGRAAHSGSSFEEGVSAILELSHQVQRLFALNDRTCGITVNVGTIDGGLRPNVVAPRASAVVSVRASTTRGAREVEQAIRNLEPTLEGATIEVEGRFSRPPMEPLPRNRELLGSAIRLGHELGLTLEDAGIAGGASDANTASLCTATLDGLGPLGYGSHATDERVLVASLPERAALLALLLLEPLIQPEPRRRPARARGRRSVAIVGSPGNVANGALVAAWRALGIPTRLIDAQMAAGAAEAGAVLLGRLDVLPTLDGVEAGLLTLLRLQRRGVAVLNSAHALVQAHDKLLTARLLGRCGLPHPRTLHVAPHGALPEVELPVVLKPRFGSWGADVFRCRTRAELEDTLDEIQERPWFRRHGVLVQELVPPRGRDLRILVASGQIVGAIERVAAPGEWRTNISLGGSRRHADPPRDALELALAAAAALGSDLIGVDLLPLNGDFTILELNGAVDFTSEYSRDHRDVFADTAAALGLVLPSRAAASDIGEVAEAPSANYAWRSHSSRSRLMATSRSHRRHAESHRDG